MMGRAAGSIRLAMAVTLVALAGVLAGCASEDGAGPAATGAPPTTATPATTGPPVTTTAPGGGSTVPATTLVDYLRSGGFAGLEDHLVVMGDGRAVVEGKGPRREDRLDAATMRELVAALDQADLARLGRPSDPPQGSDLFEHTITYQGRTVTVTDTAVPQQVRPLLALLARIIAQLR
jgi:hypothetical protein